MSSVSLLVFLALCSHLVHAQGTKPNPRDCPKSFTCGKLGNLGYPFTNYSCPRPDRLPLSGCDANASIHLKKGGRGLTVENISQSDIIGINDPELQHQLHSKNCSYFEDLALPETPFYSLYVSRNLTMFKCKHSPPSPFWENSSHVDCSLQHYTIYYKHQHYDSSGPPPHCSIIHLPSKSKHPPPKGYTGDLFSLLSAQFSLQVMINGDCLACHHLGGECQDDGCHHLGSDCKHDSKGKFPCPKGNDNSGLKLGLGLGLGLGIGFAFIVGICLFLWRCNKQKHASSEYNMRNTSSDPSTADLEEGTVHNGVHVFLYSELEESTNHFNESNEIGDGGFGAVYYGKLKDGREVAVKRLYEHNCKRLEQFINEIQILARLRHKNLVSLYGCTSRRSRELLLVYEFIPNGTLAYHLHGEGSKPGSSMAWPIRMSIAVETANALAYLHASDIIHRDVKTDNILLDNNYSVKVADFGLSRLFPVDVTHVSTAPQGTPGYVDPEYHQCYQLTDKSDVYSFGVVLIELISSMPAVDITRHRHNINLANLALNRIQEGTFTELVDPNLGFDSDDGTRTMILLVAELAFRCLQQDNEVRPDMEEVLETLRMIQGGGSTDFGRVSCTERPCKDLRATKTEMPPRSPGCCDKIGLLKNVQVVVPPASPDTVTERWLSSSSTKTNPSM